MDDNNYVTVLESFVITFSLHVTKGYTEKVSGLDHLVLANKRSISSVKALNMICHTTQHGVCSELHPSLSSQFRTSDCQLQYRGLLHNVYSDTLFATTVSRRGNRCAQIFATNNGCLCSSSIKLKSEAREMLSLLFQQDGCHLL